MFKVVTGNDPKKLGEYSIFVNIFTKIGSCITDLVKRSQQEAEALTKARGVPSNYFVIVLSLNHAVV